MIEANEALDIIILINDYVNHGEEEDVGDSIGLIQTNLKIDIRDFNVQRKHFYDKYVKERAVNEVNTLIEAMQMDPILYATPIIKYLSQKKDTSYLEQLKKYNIFIQQVSMEITSSKAVSGIDYETLYNIFYECSKIIEARWGLSSALFYNKNYFNDFGQYFQPIQGDAEKALFFGPLKGQCCPLHIECAVDVVNYIVITNPFVAIPAMIKSLKDDYNRIKPLYDNVLIQNSGTEPVRKRIVMLDDYVKTLQGLVQ